MQTLKGSEDKLMILDVHTLHLLGYFWSSFAWKSRSDWERKRGLLRLMEMHQQPHRGCKSPLLSMNNTKLRSYYVLGLSWVIITAPNPFSRPAVCIKRIFSPLLIKGLAVISSDLQLFTYLQKKKSHHLLLLISDHLFLFSL